MKKHKITPSFQRRLESRTYKRKALLWLSLGIFVMLTALFSYIFWPKTISNVQSTINNQPSASDTPSPVIPAQAGIQTPPPPATYDISVPYAPQAPLSNWTVHEESCEEAAIYMYRAFLEGTTYPGNRVPDAEADTVYRDMKSWQVKNYGKEPDLTMTALGAFAQSYYGYTPHVEKGITADNIKRAVSSGNPVIVPVMTHSLENKMYGPYTTYHVLLIKGYDATGVITNDAGVGNGVGKHYDWNILWQAIDAQTASMGAGRELLYLTK